MGGAAGDGMKRAGVFQLFRPSGGSGFPISPLIIAVRIERPDAAADEMRKRRKAHPISSSSYLDGEDISSSSLPRVLPHMPTRRNSRLKPL